LYASVTDYAAIYTDAYRMRQGEHTSFDRSVLPPQIAEFARSVDCRRALDVSGGQGNLGRELCALGIKTVTTDFGVLPGSEVIRFNLGEYEEGQIDRVLRAVNPDAGPFLTTCFDVLEHIDREHVAAAIHNLSRLTDRFLLLSVSTRPSVFDNLLHSALMPVGTWIRAFEASGFTLLKLDAFPTALAQRTFPVTDELCLINRWIGADIFSDIAAGEPRYLILEKVRSPRNHEEVRAEIEMLVDVAYRRAKRARFGQAGDGRINFTFQLEQDWSNLRPLLDVVPRSQARFLIRPETIERDTLRAARSFLRRSGVDIVEFAEAGDLPWRELRGEVVVSAAESSVGGGHLLSHETAALARLHGCRTFLLQHGIWPRPFEDKVLTFASEHVLTWGREEERRLNDRRHRILGTEVPWGVLPPHQARPIGGPKFCDQFLGPFPGLPAKFGFDPARFDRVVLVGTKNLRGRWGLDNLDGRFMGELARLVESQPRTLFIIRPHPRDSAESFAAFRQPNVIVFDEVVGILADMPLNRVLPYVDLVATSPSSLILDAAVSAKPVFVYDTGQPLEYDMVQAEPFAGLAHYAAPGVELSPLTEVSRRFKAHYAEAVDDTFYEAFSGLLREARKPPLDAFAAASATLAYQAVKDSRALARVGAETAAISAELWAQRQQHATTLGELEAQRQQHATTLGELEVQRQQHATTLGELETARARQSGTEAELRAMVDTAAVLRGELDAAQVQGAQLAARKAALERSTSWRVTAPLRSVIGALRRIRGL
jgi:hypothetical protein